MDFFSRQDQAKRTTARLVVYFTVAVALIFVAVDCLLYLTARLSGYDTGEGTLLVHGWTLQALLGTLILIGGGSLLEWLRLREGGTAIADIMGAKRLDFATRDPLERQFLNISEEMAIASGMPAPTLYVLEREAAINAFVAGYDQQHSVLVVTQGALEHLSRAELQGVIGHEFSHVLNGDMRINMRLLAILAGILALGQVGGFLMRSASNSNVHGRRNNREQNSLALVVFVFGLGMWLIGYIGLFFGRLIKAAVAREREKLADAASVQFTRYPDGLAGALYKISTFGSRLDSLHAEEMSHMCIGESLHFNRLFATHPPIEERINAIAPSFLVRVKYREPLASPPPPASVSAQTDTSDSLIAFSPVEPPSARPATTANTDAIAAEVTPAVAPPFSQRVGALTMADLQSAQQLHRNLPVEVTRALQTSTGAKAVLFALLAHHQHTDAAAVSAFFASQQSFGQWVEQLKQQLLSLDQRFALPVVDLALPRLRLLEPEAGKAFIVELRRFVLLNQEVSALEFALLKLIEQQFQPGGPVFRTHGIDKLAQPVAQLVATLLEHGAHPPADRETVYRQLLAPVLTPVPALPPPEQRSLKELDRSLRQFRYLNPEGKKALLNLAATTIQSDGVLLLAEYELLRVIAALLACPLPLLPGTIETGQG
jgi:Zn-dependent protease with chaperone function